MTHFYHEKQHLQHCLKHALNNLLQHEAFSLQQLNKLTDSIGAKRTWILGNYDANVLAAALSLHNMEVKWHDARDSELSSLNLQQVHQQALQGVGCSRASTGSPTDNPAVTHALAGGQQETAKMQQEEGEEEQEEKGPHHLQQLVQCSGQQLQLQEQQEVTDSSSTQLLQSASTTEQQQQPPHHLQQQQAITDSSSAQLQQTTSTQKQQQEPSHHLQHQQETTNSSSTQLQQTTSTQELLLQQSPRQLQQQQESQHSQQQQPQQHEHSSPRQQLQQGPLLVGLVVNIAGRGWWSAITGGRHWLAIKYIDGQWWNLDSNLSAPEAFSPEPASSSAISAVDGGSEQLTHYLQQQLAEGAHIIAVYQQCAS